MSSPMSADIRTPPAATPTLPVSPTPRRWARPRWINLRVIVGLLLVVASMVAGARFLAADRETVEIWSVRADLAAGAVLRAEDLEPLQVRLGESSDLYLAADSSSPIGQELNRALRAGELLPAGAVGFADDGRVVVLPVQPDRLPAGVVHGSTVDIYLQTGRGSGEAATERVLEAITVQDVDDGTGGLASISGTVQISVALTPQQAELLVPALADGEVVLVLVTGR